MGAFLINLFVYALMGLVLYQSRQQYARQAVLTTQNLAHSLSINVSGVLDKIDGGLFAVATEVERQIQAGGINEKSLNAYLTRQQAQIRDLEGMWVANGGGDVHWGTIMPGGKPVSIADREYYQRLHDNAAPGLVISKPVIGRITKAWSVLLSRRINYADGSFAGVALGSLRVMDYFTEMFSGINVGKGGLIGLRDDELALIVRYPKATNESGQPGSKVVSARTLEMTRSNPDSGSYEAVAAQDGIERIYSYQKVPRHPLYIFVSQSTDDFLSPWRKEATITLSLAAIFTMLTVLFARISIKRAMEIIAAEHVERRKDELELLITQRKEADEALRESENRMSAVFHGSPIGISIIRISDGTFVDVNDAVLRMLGFQRDEMIGRTSLDLQIFVHPVQREEGMQRLREHGSIDQFPIDYRKKTGEVGVMEYSGRIADVHGDQCIVGMWVNVTERKQAEAALNISEERLRLAMEATQQGWFDLNIQTGEVVASPAFARIVGGDSANLPMSRQLWIESIHREDRDAVLQVFQKCLQTHEPQHMEYRMITKSGEWKWIHSAAKVVATDATGLPLRMTGTHADITELKRAGQRVKESEERYRALIEQSPIGIFVHRDGKFLYLNPTATSLLGATSASDLIGKPILDIIHPDFRDLVQKRVKNAQAGIVNPMNQQKLIRVDGSAFDAEIQGTPIQYEGTPAIQASFLDISERKQHEAALRQLNEELELRIHTRTRDLQIANSELESFSYSVSHDLRAPLRAIEGFSGLLEREYSEKLDERAKDYFKRVRGGVARMAALIDDLLNLSRISRQKMHRGPVNLSALAQEAVNEFQTAEPERQVEWVIAPDIVAEGDSGLLRIALQNLMGNAWKYSSKREVARIEFGVCEWNNRPAFFVRDNGDGFDMAHADKLFGAFQRLHSSGEFPGTGIGLATVARIVRRHGGTVGAEGKVHAGATFYFTL